MIELWEATHAENTFVMAVNGIDLHVLIAAAPNRAPRGQRGAMDRDDVFAADWQWRDRLIRLGNRLTRVPERHLQLLREVPIIIATRIASQATTGGGWFPPAGASGSAPMSRWFQRDTGVTEEQLNAIPHSRGIIGVTVDAFTQSAPQGRYQGDVIYRAEFSILHEIGHCVDLHFSRSPGRRYGGLHSRPASASYRGDRQPYASQRYDHGPGWVPLNWSATAEQPAFVDPRPRTYDSLMSEFAAEAYSRLFLCPASICRGQQGTPSCTSHNAVICAARIQTDLLHTPAFQALQVPRNYLPNVGAAPPVEEEESREAAARPNRPGPQREVVSGHGQHMHVNPRASARQPGPVT